MVTVTCTRCGARGAIADHFGAVHCRACGLFKKGEPTVASGTSTSMTSFLCKGCGSCVFTNEVPADRRCFHCIAKASPPAGTAVPAPKERGAKDYALGEPPYPGAAFDPRRARSKPHRCPVCDGRGQVPHGFYALQPAIGGFDPCRSCKGAGLVWG